MVIEWTPENKWSLSAINYDVISAIHKLEESVIS
jgi:hypothetical protein